MAIISFENWTVNPTEDGGYTLNAWVGPDTHAELQRLMPQFYARSNLNLMALRFEYNVAIAGDAIKRCSGIDGWYFTLPGSQLESISFALIFSDRKQNFKSRKELDNLFFCTK